MQTSTKGRQVNQPNPISNKHIQINSIQVFIRICIKLYSLVDISQLKKPHIFISDLQHVLFPETLRKMPTNTLFRNVKESEEIIPETIPFSRAVPKVSGVYFGPRSILHSSIVDIHRVVVMKCNPAHKAMNNKTNKKKDTDKNITPLVEVIIHQRVEQFIEYNMPSCGVGVLEIIHLE